jgi:hypothetical protein
MFPRDESLALGLATKVCATVCFFTRYQRNTLRETSRLCKKCRPAIRYTGQYRLQTILWRIVRHSRFCAVVALVSRQFHLSFKTHLLARGLHSPFRLYHIHTSYCSTNGTRRCGDIYRHRSFLYLRGVSKIGSAAREPEILHYLICGFRPSQTTNQAFGQRLASSLHAVKKNTGDSRHHLLQE